MRQSFINTSVKWQQKENEEEQKDKKSSWEEETEQKSEGPADSEMFNQELWYNSSTWTGPEPETLQIFISDTHSDINIGIILNLDLDILTFEHS